MLVYNTPILTCLMFVISDQTTLPATDEALTDVISLLHCITSVYSK